MNRKIVNYTIIVMDHITDLDWKVTEHIDDLGYQPYGSPFQANGKACQAMVQYENNHEENHK